MNLFGRKETGAIGEKAAEKALKKKNYVLVERNLRFKNGEIDLLMWDKDELVIIEVRTIVRETTVAPEERVPRTKQNKLINLGQQVASQYDDPPPIRFDVCSVTLEPELVIHHFVDAFRP